MHNSIESKSDSIQLVYDNYVDEKYLVNRRYQRKLVWEEEEKIKFIDSILKKYPVPLFLMATVSIPNEPLRYEIIDGMQRLNAIVAFIENEIGVAIGETVKYFDLSILANTNQRQKEGKLIQKYPVLDKSTCMEFLQYQLPFSYISAPIDEIDEVFRRINSYGRRLSEQEIRQAGAVCRFSDIVREIAYEIRGDISSSGHLTLNKMQTISLSNRRLKYGIDIQSVFWVKKGIILQKNMRISRDEELIAYLVLHILFGHSVRATTKTLDQLYHNGLSDNDNLYDEAENKIILIGKSTIKTKFNQTFAIIKGILESDGGYKFSDLLFNSRKGEKISKVFQILFVAVYELINTDHLKINSYPQLVSLVRNLGNDHLSNIKDHEWDTKFRKSKVDAVKGIIKQAFSPKVGEDAMYDDWSQEIDNLLQLSRVEGGQYDFKLGFHDLKTGLLDDKKVHKLIKILTAQVNKAPWTTGYVIVGIAETQDTMEKFKSAFSISENIEKIDDSEFYLTGLDAEIEKYYKSSDEFVRYIKEKVKSAPVEESIRTQIAMDMKLPKYRGQSLLVLTLKSSREPILYDDSYFVRKGNDTEEIRTMKESIAFVKKFEETACRLTQ